MEMPIKALASPGKRWLATGPNYFLVTSALFFIIPCIVAFRVKQYFVSLACFMILVSSVAFHQHPVPFTYWADQLMIVIFAMAVSILAFKKNPWFLLCIVLFITYSFLIFYGPFAPDAAQHPDRTVSSLWHSTMHILPAGGTALILIS